MHGGFGALLTDLYQLTMLQGYFFHGMNETAVFELSVRTLPPTRNFLIAAGLEQVVSYLEELRIREDDLEHLRADRSFRPDFLEWLGRLRFTGEVDAMPEGTVFFPDEPVLRVIAPLPEAQLVETRIVNLIHFQTTVASKAARSVLVAGGKLLVDFGLRRAHGAEAGLLSARASYLAGFDGSSNVLAGRAFGIPLYGTMAHSFVQAHDDERQAFIRFARANPENSLLLIDTYDTEAGARTVVEIAPLLAREGIRIQGVRLDSGDLAAHARKVRHLLDTGGLAGARIFASGNLDEHAIKALVDAGAPIDGFGVGTRMNTSADAPYLDCAYKLQEYARRARRKRSEGKATWPGRRQVFRRRGADGAWAGDVVTCVGDAQPGEPLLEPVMAAGRRLGPLPAPGSIRQRCAAQLAQLPPGLRGLATVEPYPVQISSALEQLTAETDRNLAP